MGRLFTLLNDFQTNIDIISAFKRLRKGDCLDPEVSLDYIQANHGNKAKPLKIKTNQQTNQTTLFHTEFTHISESKCLIFKNSNMHGSDGLGEFSRCSPAWNF